MISPNLILKWGMTNCNIWQKTWFIQILVHGRRYFTATYTYLYQFQQNKCLVHLSFSIMALTPANTFCCASTNCRKIGIEESLSTFTWDLCSTLINLDSSSYTVTSMSTERKQGNICNRLNFAKNLWFYPSLIFGFITHTLVKEPPFVNGILAQFCFILGQKNLQGENIGI